MKLKNAIEIHEKAENKLKAKYQEIWMKGAELCMELKELGSYPSLEALTDHHLVVFSLHSLGQDGKIMPDQLVDVLNLILNEELEEDEVDELSSVFEGEFSEKIKIDWDVFRGIVGFIYLVRADHILEAKS